MLTAILLVVAVVIVVTTLAMIALKTFYTTDTRVRNGHDRLKQAVTEIRSIRSDGSPMKLLSQPLMTYGDNMEMVELFCDRKIGFQLHLLKLRRGLDYPIHAHTGSEQIFIAKKGTTTIRIFSKKTDKVPFLTKEIHSNGQDVHKSLHGLVCFVERNQYHTIGTDDQSSEVFCVTIPKITK